MDLKKPIKLPIHDHPLFEMVRFYGGGCKGCHINSFIYGGYYCNEPECLTWFHKECGEAPSEINHHSHPQHPLILTNDSEETPCDICGQKLLPPCYSCSTCDHFKVHLICGMKSFPPNIEQPTCHEHSVVFLKTQEKKVTCEFCKEPNGGCSYSCLKCSMYFHLDCIHLSNEVNHACHTSHPLKLIASNALRYDADKYCLICEQPMDVFYHCSICNFTSCIRCTINPPPLVIEHTKTHKHPLTRFSKRISFICDVCGTQGQTGAYICVECDFIIHLQCIGFAHVINMNRHEHRIYFTYNSVIGYPNCGVCHQYITPYKGAYSCSICPNVSIHFWCAHKGWDGRDYEGTPEIIEDVAPYMVVGYNLIYHFSHEKHFLKLYKGDIFRNDDHKLCEACVYPLGFGSIFACDECGFFLHEKCANIPMKKKLVFDIVPYTLKAVREMGYCIICKMLSDGFKYTAQGRNDIDVRCGSITEPFIHDSHIHPLYVRVLAKGIICGGCNKKIDGFVLCCDDNYEFGLCFYCASLPKKIWHKNHDVHPLTLCFGENASVKYWCDTCEEELDPSKWFYTCSDCGVSLHIRCVLGDFSCLMIGSKDNYEVVLNNQNTRPLCRQCHSRCKSLVILKDIDNKYICSYFCLYHYSGIDEMLSNSSLDMNPMYTIMRRSVEVE